MLANLGTIEQSNIVLKWILEGYVPANVPLWGYFFHSMEVNGYRKLLVTAFFKISSFVLKEERKLYRFVVNYDRFSFLGELCFYKHRVY